MKRYSKYKLINSLKNNVLFFFRELNGSLGDIGVLIPIVISLAKLGVDIRISLFLIGLAYIFNGIIYRLPVSVQPMKGISSVVIVSKLNPIVVPISAFIISIILGILNYFKLFNKLKIDISLIRGIQVGVGILLIIAAYKIITYSLNHNLFNLVYELIVFSLILIIGLLTNWLIPSILILIIIALFISSNSINNFYFNLSFANFATFLNLFNENILIKNILSRDLSNILFVSFVLVIVQLPITVGNAIIASSKTIEDLYLNKVSESKIALTCSSYNFFIGLLGGIPVCHGSGGITAHYSAGARSSLAPILIGFILIFISFINNISLVFLNFPNTILSILLVFVGLKHMTFIFKLSNSYQYIKAFITSCVFIFISLNIHLLFKF